MQSLLIRRAGRPCVRCGVLITVLAGAGVAMAQPARVAPPDPTRFAKDIESFANWDKKNSFPRDAVLFVGSSSMVMWPTHAAFPEWPVINRGFGGSHTSDVNHYFDQVVRPYQPRCIVMYCGDNDVAAGIAPEHVRDDYIEFLRKIRADQPQVPVIILSIKPSNSRWEHWPAMQRANELLRELAAKEEHVRFVDMGAVLLGEDGRPLADLFLADQLHLSPAGYAKWERVLRPVLAEAMKTPEKP